MISPRRKLQMVQGEGGKGYRVPRPKQKDILLPLLHGEMEGRFSE